MSMLEGKLMYSRCVHDLNFEAKACDHLLLINESIRKCDEQNEGQEGFNLLPKF